MNTPAMNWMQKEAMLVLLRKDQASMKDLRPGDVQANLFAYHFEELVQKGLVSKVDRGLYQLTPTGHRFANRISADSGLVVEEIKTVIMLYGKDENSYLLFRRSRQPHIGKIGLIHDRMHRDWSLQEAVENALTEKLGNSDLSVRYIKSLLVKIEHEDVIVSHLHALVYEVDLSELKTTLPFRSKNGTAFIGSIGTLSQDEVLDGLLGLIKKIESYNPGGVEEVHLSYRIKR